MRGLGDHRADRDHAIALVWAGMVLGVSFVATPAKFLAPSLPLPIAIDVGRHTFRTFGRIELALMVLFGLRAEVSARPLALVPGFIVLAQALWLRPRLGARTQSIIEGGVAPPSSKLHFAYVACEAVKLSVLLVLGLTTARPRIDRNSR